MHLPNTVRELGPLWVYSFFHFEGLNGILKNLAHGTQQVDKQLITSYSYVKQLPAIANEYTQSSPHIEAFKHIYYQHKQRLTNQTKISKDVYLLGKPVKSELTDNEQLALSSYVLQDHSCVDRYCRMLFKDVHYYSCKWNKNNQQRNNATIAYHKKGEVHFQSFLLYNCSPPLLFCVLAKLVRSDHPFTMFHSSYKIPHIISCLPPIENHEIAIIPFEHIHSLCVYMSYSDVKDTVYLVVPSILFEKD